MLTVVLAASAASSVLLASMLVLPAPMVMASAVASLALSSTAPVAVVTLRVKDVATPERSWLVYVEAFRVEAEFRFTLEVDVTTAAIT